MVGLSTYEYGVMMAMQNGYTPSDSDSYQYISTAERIKELLDKTTSDHVKALVEEFRCLYRDSGGTVQGQEKTWQEFCKKVKPPRRAQVAEELMSNFRRQLKELAFMKASGRFCPPLKHLKTYISQGSWDTQYCQLPTTEGDDLWGEVYKKYREKANEVSPGLKKHLSEDQLLKYIAGDEMWAFFVNNVPSTKRTQEFWELHKQYQKTAQEIELINFMKSCF